VLVTGTAFVTGGSGFIGSTLIRRLRADGWTVRALARSDRSAAAVTAAGASPVRTDLDGLPEAAAELAGCEVAFHAAAHTAEFDRPEIFEAINVGGTEAMIEACRRAGVRRLVHVSTEAALLAGDPLIDVDEEAPLRPDSPQPYCATKARAEQAVLAADGAELETVVVRPRMVWGRGDSTILPAVLAAVGKKRFRWIGDGRHRTSTTHVDNAVEGLMLAARATQHGRVWFVTDGEPVIFCDFLTRLVATQGIELPDGRMPPGLARTAAASMEGIWRGLHLKGSPPLTTMAVWLSSLEVTIDIGRATQELGYRPRTTMADGLAELAADVTPRERTP